VNSKIENFLNAIAPLAKSESDFGEILIISFLESRWNCGDCTKKVRVNDVLKSIKHYSTASLNRKLKQLKDKEVLFFRASSIDERVKLIEKGPNYNEYLAEIGSSIEEDIHAQLH